MMEKERGNRYCFGKEEKLCSKQLIEKLYSSPHRELFFPLSIHWQFVEAPEETPRVQVLVVAPKKKLRHAVDRNRTKRVIRECYRLHKQPLVDSLAHDKKHITLAINYIHTSTPNFHKLSRTMEKLVAKLVVATSAHD